MADLNTSFTATGNLTASDPLSISTGTVKLTVNDPVETGVSSIATSGTNTLLSATAQGANDYWIYLRNTSATAIDVTVTGNLKGTDGNAGWVAGGGSANYDVPFLTLKQNDWCWYPVVGTALSGVSEARGVKVTNTSGAAVATVEYGIYKKN
tara:strand:+ start:146 stop:601 length:456 start_codon:yes stop_codon:yes gene_type:complete